MHNTPIYHGKRKVPISVDVSIAVFSALFASLSVTPLVLTIDRAVIQAAAGTCKLFPGIRIGTLNFLLRPRSVIFTIPFALVWGVCGSTYIAANVLDVYNERKARELRAASLTKLFGTTAVNMTASLIRDVTFAKMFGKQVEKAAQKVPPSTYGIFILRDTLTMAGGFTVPPLMSGALTNIFGFEKSRSDKIAQLASPAALQIVCTPLHLLALNMYNEQGVTAAHRLATVKKTLLSSTLIRMFRFSVAYGIGLIGNKYFVRRGREWAENKYR